MNKELQNKLAEFAKEAGWEVIYKHSEQVLVTKPLKDSFLVGFFRVFELVDSLEFVSGAGVGNQDFGDAISFIMKDDRSFTPICKQKGPSVENMTFTTAFFKTQTEELTEWANGIDLEEELNKLSAPSERGYGINSFLHLSSLAVQRNSEKLEGYLNSFRKEEPLPFPRMIKEVHLEKALEFSKRTK